MPNLYAWAVPAWFNGNVLDHTWVTSYDNQSQHYPTIQQVTAAKENYWYCWGGYHPVGGIPGNPTGALGHQQGSLAVAKCLVKPNLPTKGNPPAQGTIFTYGVDGVCHQLANQVLYATASAKVRPLKVSKARGYLFSSLIYGDYGLQYAAWNAKRRSCSATDAKVAAWSQKAVPMTEPKDDFETQAAEVLSDDPELLRELLKLRTDIQGYAALKMPGFQAPSAATINARNQHFLDQVGLLLGPERFEKLFGFPIGQQVNLIDPDMVEQK